MNDPIDFSNCKRVFRNYGGSDRKFGVEYNGEIYLLKFSGEHAKKHDISTSAVNNVVSEYISSHISSSVNLPTHQTYLGLYKEEVVVGCKDFRNDSEQNLEFGELVKAVYDSKDVTRHVLLQQIYDSLYNPINNLSQQLIDESIERFWETFVVDSLVGNFDRHMGNWGFITANNQIQRLAPIYDYGSTLFPNLSDEGAAAIINNDYEMIKRCIVFPSPVLCVTREKVGKVGYYDILSSNYDTNCTRALLKIAPKISLESINSIIDETPMITDLRKQFYKNILALRKAVIIDRAYEKCLSKNYDEQSLENITTGKQRNDADIQALLGNSNIQNLLHTLSCKYEVDEEKQTKYKKIKKSKQVEYGDDD